MTQHTNASRVAIVLSLLLVMVALQLAAVRMRSFWEDESVTAGLVRESFGRIIQQRGNDNHPPLYWLSAAAWSRVAGSTEVSLKLYSLIWLAAAFLLVYQLALDMFGERVALISIALFAFSPLVLTYGHNARYYSMAAALSLLATLAMYRYLDSARRWWLVIYVLAGVALMYSVYTGGVVLLALNVWWLIQWLRKERRLGELLVWGIAQAIILLAYLPWVTTLAGAVGRNFESLPESSWLAGLAVRAGYLGYAFEVGEFYSPLNPLAWLGALLVTGACVYAIYKNYRGLGLPLTVLLVSGGISVVANFLAVYPQSAWQGLPNRAFFIYPFFLIILAYGLAQLKSAWFPIVIAAILVVYAAGIFNYFTNREVIKPILTVPWWEIMARVKSEASEDAAVICTSHDVACFYYQTLFGYERTDPNQIGEVLEQHPAEIWWIQSNRGEYANFKGSYAEEFSALQAQYVQESIYQFVPHDPEIAMLKKKFLGQEAFEYRVTVYKFVTPQE